MVQQVMTLESLQSQPHMNIKPKTPVFVSRRVRRSQVLSSSPAITPIAASELDISDIDDTQPEHVVEKQAKETFGEAQNAQKVKFKTIELKTSEEEDWILSEEPMKRDELKFGYNYAKQGT